jgi:hypothetical protein
MPLEPEPPIEPLVLEPALFAPALVVPVLVEVELPEAPLIIPEPTLTPLLLDVPLAPLVVDAPPVPVSELPPPAPVPPLMALPVLAEEPVLGPLELHAKVTAAASPPNP